MHFKSLRSFVVMLVGACILTAVAALVIYSVVSTSRSQATVESQTRELIKGNVKERLMVLASSQAETVQRQLEKAMTLGRNLADTNALMGKRDVNGEPLLELSREELSNLARNTVIENPLLLDAFIGWEPNAFGDDSNFLDRTAEGFDETGRFMPWWYRDGDGNMQVFALGKDLENEALDSLGFRKGEYYLCVKENKRACITDPHFYDYNGETLMIMSFNAPILVDGQFRGIGGVDLSVDFTQELLGEANQSLYEGAGEMRLISSNGVIGADTASVKNLSTLAKKSLSEKALAGFTKAQSGKPIYGLNEADGQFELYWPFTVGENPKPWVLSIRLPESAVLADLHVLQADMKAQRSADIIGMSLMGLLIAALGLGASWFMGSSIARPLRRLADRMRDIASGNGDLTQRLPVKGRNETAELATQFNAFADKINNVLLDVRESSESVRVAATEIAMGGQDLSSRSETAASNIQETSASMEQLTSTVEHTAQSSRQANKLSESASEVATRGGQVVSDVVQTMDEIDASSKQIAEIVTVMDGIAFQTNLLALNASVEAARAGEQGRGFAVVASEVRQLAGRSADAAQQIKGLIDNSSNKTRAGAEQVRLAGATMDEIVASVARVTDVLGEISAATNEQSQGIGQVNQAVAELDRMTQENAAMVEESTTAAGHLQEQSQRLAQIVGAFTLASRNGDKALLTPPPAVRKTTEHPESELA
ncbi:methyl-accepting chemotaxis protein [Halomonas sp. PR-M31]|uniref:methyl-accepting chemotaxis protein n=1 Tax=Halomonas sp. PR-M31 TaxID=1471202 RepID=UPI000650FF29|nr:methyl-accepting chemotaxis protein [Halomonas sp. PR-M31]